MSKGKLNVYRDSFLEKEELDRLMSFINDNAALFLFVSNAQSFGILQQGTTTTNDTAFKVEVGTNANTIKIGADSYALDKNGAMIYQRAFDNLPVPTDSLWYWVKISHRYDNYEPGFVNIAVDGTISGASTLFTEVLRGSSSGFPVKIKFYTQADDGTLTPATNSGTYEVVNVVSDNTAIIAGNLTVETQLRYVVLGAFSVNTSVAAITSTGLYSYDSCNIEFVAEEVNDTAPIIGLTTDEEFYIARVYCNGAAVTLYDKRLSYYYRFNISNINVGDASKANIGADNITVNSWLAKLSVYTQAQITSYLSGKAAIDGGNLTAGNLATWRSLLSVYTMAQIDAMTNVSGKANVGADNITVSSWLAKLVIYTTAQVDAALALRCLKSANLSDVNAATAASNLGVDLTTAADVKHNLRCLKSANLSDVDAAASRGNLNVYSKDEQGLLLTVVVEIGDWNMDSTGTKAIAHGLTWTKIRTVLVLIRRDDDSVRFPLDHGNAVVPNGCWYVNATNLILLRSDTGIFNDPAFAATSYNRGWVTIQYIA